MTLRRIPSLIRKAIIVVLTLAAVGTGGAWIDSYRVGPPQKYDSLCDFAGIHLGYTTAEEPTASTRPRSNTGSGLRLTTVDWSVYLYNRKGGLRLSLWSCSDAPAKGSLRMWPGISYSAGMGIGELCEYVTPDGIGVSGFPNTYRLSMPLWLPFLLFAAYPTITFFIRGPLRRYRRRKRGLCLTCGYDLMGNVTGVCSECGKEIVKP